MSTPRVLPEVVREETTPTLKINVDDEYFPNATNKGLGSPLRL